MVKDPKLAGCLIATIPLHGRSVPLRIDPDGPDLETSLVIAQTVGKTLEVLEAEASAIAADHLLERYNNDWRSVYEANGDGTYREVDGPLLTKTEFQQTNGLVSASVTGAMVQFCFDDADLFGGHSIFVQSFDGLPMKDADVSLFG
ncbi:DUF2262 domain-containing protein [Rhodobacteraceae bacterium N5(2021)]|uniref:DUF2262 domain-containing protein n=1 Tax=Gymnodinialimonas phycosphaerae TaxID=2841589 RepID=A0A975TSF0_9RHOB|nr:DUF2262 domain-containing protein [Gymnodinialimonas phycosphaerae]MBY4893659.1 DUF2262 domain-containing protein [Gymnodinialimonas phycosphaerae]